MMARDEWGMLLPDKSSPLPWTPYGIPHLTENGYDLCTPEGDGQNAKAVEVYGSEDDCKFVVHAINNIVACREITRRLKDLSKSTLAGPQVFIDLMDDASELWRKMQSQAEAEQTK
jgi:hypothetical protein